jgi:hypothetical protein
MINVICQANSADTEKIPISLRKIPVEREREREREERRRKDNCVIA